MPANLLHRLGRLAAIPTLLLLAQPLGGGACRASVPSTPAAVDSSLGLFRYASVGSMPEAQRDSIYSEYVVTVRQALDTAEWTRAQRLAQRAIVLWPERQRPHLHLAQAEIGAQRWSPCIVAARQARHAAPDDVAPVAVRKESHAAADYWEGLGFYQTQRYDEALPFLVKAAQASPDWAEAQRALGECAFVMGDKAAAAHAYERAFQLDAAVGGVRDLSYYADAMTAQGDRDAGIAALEAALRRYPYESGLHARLGTEYRQEGNLTEAYYQFTLEFLVQGARGEFSQPAIQAANEIYLEVEADRESPFRHELLLISTGMNDLRSGQANEALRSLEHALNVTRTNTVVPYLFLADAQLHLQLFAEAQRTLNQALTLQPDFVPALVLMAKALKALDDDAAAQALVEHAFELFPTYWKLQPENVRQRG